MFLRPRYISEINFMSLSIKDMTMSLDHLPVKKGLKFVKHRYLFSNQI